MDDNKSYTFNEFLNTEFPAETEIGCAKFVSSNLTIQLRLAGIDGGYFEVDMERGDLISWLNHIWRKSWATSEMVGDLVRVWLANTK